MGLAVSKDAVDLYYSEKNETSMIVFHRFGNISVAPNCASYVLFSGVKADIYQRSLSMLADNYYDNECYCNGSPITADDSDIYDFAEHNGYIKCTIG